MRGTPRPLATLAIVALTGLLSAGCGSSASSGGATATAGSAAAAAPTTPTASEKAVRFAECMRAHGVGDFPDPTDKDADAYGVSVSPAVFTRAADACKALKPPGALSSTYTPKQLSAAVRFAQCVRDKGVKDFPDPTDGEPLIDTTRIPSTDQPGGMTILNAATTSCTSLLRQAMAARG